MLKKITHRFKKNLRLVKKYPSRIEAELAKEILGFYHIHAYILNDYFGRVSALFVSNQDYQFAYRLLKV